MQRKFPFLGIVLLYLLAGVELLAFPLLGAGTAVTGALSIQCFLFGCLCGAHMLVLRIIQELWQSSGGVFNVDEVLQQMVYGLEEELELRSKGRFASQKGPMAGGPDNDWVPSPMQWAAAAGSVDTCRWLRARGLELGHVNPAGHGAVGKAAWQGHRELLSWLVAADDGPQLAAQLAARDAKGRLPSELARDNGHPEVGAWLEGLASGAVGLRTKPAL